MKTDRFSDSIRRKLESIRPDFNEKDWARMQATLMHHATPPPSGSPTAFQPTAGSVWSAQTWMTMAAAVSTVALVTVAIWQQGQISQLHHRVSQLTQQQTATRQQPATSETTNPGAMPLPAGQQTAQQSQRSDAQPGSADPARPPALTSRDAATASRRDTVYVTQYVAVPDRSTRTAQERTVQRSTHAPALPLTTGRSGNDRLVDRANKTDRISSDPASTDRLSTDPSSSVATAQPLNRPGVPSRSTNVTATDETRPVADGTTSDGTTNVATNETLTGNRAKSSSAPAGSVSNKPTFRSSDRPVATTVAGRRKRSSSAAGMAATTPTNTNGSGNSTDSEDVTTNETVATAGSAEPTVSYELAMSQPLTMDAKDWSKALYRRSRQMRPARTTVVSGVAAAEPASQPSSQPARRLALGVRVGAGVDVAQKVLTGSILTELLVGNHLLLGVGLGKSSFAGGQFGTDEDFDRDMSQNFRHNFARNINPQNAIINIGIHTERIQLPLSFGYRIPLSQTVSLLPSIGTTLNLQSTQYSTFFNRQPLQGLEEVHFQRSPPVRLFDNLNVGTSVEWRKKHWVGQAGPLLTMPLLADASWQQGTSIGLRARLFYQF